MSIDEKATIGSILATLKQEGVTTGVVAKQINGLSEKPFRKALKAAGYEFSNKVPKGWHFIGEGEEPLDKSIFDFVERGSSSVKKSSSDKKWNSSSIHPSFTEDHKKATDGHIEVITDSPLVHPQFTHDEVKMIKEMLHQWQKVASQTAAAQAEEKIEDDKELSLHDRIKTLSQDNTTRKTIVIDNEIGKQLDEFCKNERVNKSDVLNLALMDFLNKWH